MSGSNLQATWQTRVGAWVAALFLFTLIFDGVFRWLLSSAGIPSAIYLRDVLPVGVMFLATLSAWQGRDRKWLRFFCLLWLFAVLVFLYSLARGTPLLQILFGMKTLWLLPTGAALYLLLQHSKDQVVAFCSLGLLIVCGGLLLDGITDTPWQGASYQVGDIDVEAQREWTIDSVERLAGFSRASFDAACQMAVFVAVLLAAQGGVLFRWPLIVAGIAGVYGTTSRSALIGLVTLLLCYLLVAFPRIPKAVRLLAMPVTLISPAVFILTLAVPGVTTYIVSMDSGGAGSTASFAMRSEEVWLDALSMLQSSTEWLFGLGFGGIGAAQKAFDPESYNPGDNLFLYCLVTWGIVGAVLTFGVLSKAWYCTLRVGELPTYGLIIPLISGVGVTITGLENPWLALGLGLALAEVYAERGRE